MDAKALKKIIQTNAGDRTKLVDNLLAELSKAIAGAQKQLLQRFINDWVDKLDTDSATGKIKNTLRNKRLLANVDNVFNQYIKTDGVIVAKAIVDGVQRVMDFNGKYYKPFATKAELIPIKAQVVDLVESWLGMKGNGWLEGNGYLAKTISNPQILTDLKNFAFRAVVGQQGYEATKTAVKGYIEGNKQGAGLLERYARNFTYDLYSQVDRATAGVYAEKLGMDYAIYEGGLIKTSRKFCKDHNGKVYTREEITLFNPKVGIPDNYNPFTDLGGYGCRHHLNWVPKAVALILRPELA